MEKYLGLKIVQAEPMNEASFINQVKNQDVPSNFLRREGYKVISEDESVSWLPKEEFEKVYKISRDYDSFLLEVNCNTGNGITPDFFKMFTRIVMGLK